MSDTTHDGRLRLVPLVSTLAGIEKPVLNLDQIFDLAMKDEVRLYVRLPSDRAAHVDHLLPMVTHRRSSLYRTSDLWGLSRYTPKSDLIHPEVTHVALDPDQAEELKTHRISEEAVFSSGLALHPNSALAQAGWWVPCQFGASLVICPAVMTTDTEKRRRGFRPRYLKTTPEDVFVDEQFTAKLPPIENDEEEDRFQLRSRAPAVFVLYVAAKHFYGPTRPDSVNQKTVMKWFNDHKNQAVAWASSNLKNTRS